MTFSTPTPLTATAVTGSSPFVTGSVYVFADDTYYGLDVTTKATSGSTRPTSITGGGITWIFINEATSSTMNTSCWYGYPDTGATTSALTFNTAAGITEIDFVLWGCTGVDTSNPIIQSITGSKSSSTTFGSPDLTPLAPLSSATNMTISAVAHISSPDETTTSSNMTRIDETQPDGSNRNLASFYSISNVINPTHAALTAGNWRGVSYELKESLADPDPGGGGGGGVIVTGGDVKLGIWAGGKDPGFSGPEHDDDQLKWWVGQDNSAGPWKPPAGGTGIGRLPDFVRFRGAYGTGVWTDFIKYPTEAQYWADRGVGISSNIKFTTSDPTGNTDPTNLPLRDTINGHHDTYLAKQCNEIKALAPIIVYLEIFSEANVSASASQPPAPDGPWTEDFTKNGKRYYGGDSPHAFQLTGLGGNGSISSYCKNNFRDHCKYIVDFFDSKDVTNVKWVISLAGKTTSVWDTGGTKDAEVFIEPLIALNRPGVGVGGYIDVIGVDAYCKSNRAGDPGRADWDNCFAAALAYAQSKGKPLGIFETGVAPDVELTPSETSVGCSTHFTDKASWYTQGAEWIDYNKDDLDIVVFNICGTERYSPEHDTGQSFNEPSWDAFVDMVNSDAFTQNTSTINFASSSTTTNANWFGFVGKVGSFASSSTTTQGTWTGQKAESMLSGTFASSSSTTQAGWTGTASGVVGDVHVHVGGGVGSHSPLEVYLGMELR